MTEAATAATAPKRSGYLVLGKAEGTWTPLQTVQTKTAAAAIKATYDGVNGESFEAFVAIPARSWQPVTVARKTSLVIGEAS